MAILSILFILFTLSTLVFKSIAKIRVSNLMKLFTQLSPIISSKSFCTLFVRFYMKLKRPSVESSSSSPSNKYSLSSPSISSKKVESTIPCQKYPTVTLFTRFWSFLPTFYGSFCFLRCSLFCFSTEKYL